MLMVVIMVTVVMVMLMLVLMLMMTKISDTYMTTIVESSELDLAISPKRM